MIFFVSDLHLGHANIISHCHRPFRDVHAMDRSLITNWNARVDADDEVYILGDFSLASGEETNTYLSQLNGRKFLIRGNHEKCLDDTAFDESAFEWVRDYYELRAEGELFILFHYPILEWHRIKTAFQLHGHQHNPARYNHSQRSLGQRRYDVGVDANSYQPVSIKEIIAFFRGMEQVLPYEVASDQGRRPGKKRKR